MSMLEVKDLQVYYGVIQALKGISFHVEQGEVIALIGANGAGKTTTLQTLTGIIPAKAGSIIYGYGRFYKETSASFDRGIQKYTGGSKICRYHSSCGRYIQSTNG